MWSKLINHFLFRHCWHYGSRLRSYILTIYTIYTYATYWEATVLLEFDQLERLIKQVAEAHYFGDPAVVIIIILVAVGQQLALVR